MPWTDEERKSYMKAWREANKDKIKAYNKEYNKENKDKNAALFKAWMKANRDKRLAYHKEYGKTEIRIKSKRMSNWRHMGVNNVTDELHDYYMSCNNCEACGKEFTETINKCLDHNHETGDFRYVLCRWCNTYDNWKKVISHNDTP